MTTLSTLCSLKWEGELFSKGKLRAVFRGEQEVKFEDYIESSTAVPRLGSIRAFLAMSPKEGVRWRSLRVDVSQAYLKADLEPTPANNRRVIGPPADATPRWPNGEPVRFKPTHSLHGTLASQGTHTSQTSGKRGTCTWSCTSTTWRHGDRRQTSTGSRKRWRGSSEMSSQRPWIFSSGCTSCTTPTQGRSEHTRQLHCKGSTRSAVYDLRAQLARRARGS